MGRGRAKAKQTKVARQLKYNSGGTDLDRLADELGVSSSHKSQDVDPFDDERMDDPYAKYARMYDDDSADEEDGSESSGPSSRRRA
ncbi:DUF3073 domain-containing protein [Allostreptomyces psammosilenae]|uniref:DUF3073 domain-containing protein n=1 Tax=Allostreptomyces psammosilenae TaxID=1892865 RepID=A0A853A3X4_9ACTN|nr:DUF3073 domain-containing protein [Allostreptomyces psammosilenae]NYI05188.1 hypothetical protein [Allostreptomyces psammosilenae]